MGGQEVLHDRHVPEGSVTADEAVGAEARAHIARVLAEAADQHGVRILLAVESGSRAWGFGSPDSDYDVRFIYVHPRDWYVRLAEGRDVIERPLDEQLVDLAGWDVRKALRLLLRSNPALYEWVVSPVVYSDDGDFRPAARQLFEEHADASALAHHYWSIARGQWKREVEGEEAVKLKKYFYVVRPLLSLRWVVEKGTPPPMAIDALLTEVPMPVSLRAAVEDLLVKKRATLELGRGRHIPAIDDWARAELEELAPERLGLSKTPRKDATEVADQLFRRIIGIERG